MDLKDILKNVAHEPDYIFERKLNELIMKNPRYFNLDENNKKLVKDLVKKYKPSLRKGIGISAYTIKNELYRLYQNRIKLNLTEEDLKDIKEILEELRK